MTGPKPHRLTPLLAPKSIAVIGASAREGRPGYHAVNSTRVIGFEGAVFPVSPSYDEVAGHACYASIADLPHPVDLTVIAGSSVRMLSQIEAALTHGTGSLLVFANPNELSTTEPGASQRILAMTREAKVPLMGPYSIGYINFAASSALSWVEPPAEHLRSGSIATLIQSGSTYSYAHSTDPRIHFCLNLHPGQELDLSIADYMDYALSMPQTRVIGLFLEVVRDPEAFVSALRRADQTGIPVVVLNVGRTQAGARHVLSHAGRLAGRTVALDAVLERHGVFRVDTLEQWWANLLLLGHDRRPGPGGVVALTDSGGQRALLADHAEHLGVPWASISDATRARLTEQIDPTLKADNPLDAWGGEPDWRDRFEACFRALTADPGAAIGVLFTDLCVAGSDPVPAGMAEVCRKVAADCPVPVVAAQYTARQFYPAVISMLTEAGVPVLDGGYDALSAISNAFAFRDRGTNLVTDGPRPAINLSLEWTKRLGAVNALDESESLDLLATLGVPVITHRVANTSKSVLHAALEIGFPVAMKTAEPGFAHKSDVGGVKLNVSNETELLEAYERLSTKLGERVLIAPMAPRGVEISLGMITDAQFGPLVMVASGGVLIEIFKDAVFAIPPLDTGQARRLVERLRVSTQLHGVRGEQPADRDHLFQVISRFSHVAAALAPMVTEIDINPLIATPSGCLALDALIVTQSDVR